MRKLIKKALAPLVRELVQEQLEELQKQNAKNVQESVEYALLRALEMAGHNADNMIHIAQPRLTFEQKLQEKIRQQKQQS